MSRPIGMVEIGTAESGSVSARLSGEIDMSNVALITDTLLGAVREQADFMLDLRQLQFLDSQGVRMLNVLALRLGEFHRKLEVVIEATSPVSALLAITPVRNSVVVHR